MAFNGTTYRANRDRREAWATLAKAREIKALVHSDECHEWQEPRIAFHVCIARSLMHSHLTYKRLRALGL